MRRCLTKGVLTLAALVTGVAGCWTPAPPKAVRRPAAQPAPSSSPSVVRAEDADRQEVTVQLAAHRPAITMQCASPLTLSASAGSRALPPGRWTFRPSQIVPARQRYHVLVKTYSPDTAQAAAADLARWKSEGYNATLLTTGKRMRTRSGRIIDNSLQWLSLGQFATESEAEAFKARLAGRSQWSYIRAEIAEPGQGTITVLDGAGRAVAQCMLPVTLDGAQPIALDGASVGFWEDRRAFHSYSGTLELRVGPDGKEEIYERVPLETYLQGVLPAEMPDSWPAEALKAQAVAARSEILASLAGKHKLEGFDFCSSEHCRAYAGFSGRSAATDAAVLATAGEILTEGDRIVPAVFSADCGGWTENNENVWSAPPDSALRGVPDAPPSMGASPLNLSEWLRHAPPAFCSGDERYYRWTRRFTVDELTSLVSKRYDVGRVKALEPGDRGVSGRLKSIRIVGSHSSVVVQKELNIRLAFGGLPSAMFIVESEQGKSGPAAFILRGGGRGHGVGLCQYGARGMAQQGMDHFAILHHYFAGAGVETLN